MINKKLIKKNERIFIAGSRGMAGSAILRTKTPDTVEKNRAGAFNTK